jgi:hypothetical protein
MMVFDMTTSPREICRFLRRLGNELRFGAAIRSRRR